MYSSTEGSHLCCVITFAFVFLSVVNHERPSISLCGIIGIDFLEHW